MNKHPKDIFLKDLFDSFDLSVRAFNTCKRLNIPTIMDLHNFIVENNSFMGVQGCGKKTSDELLEIHNELFSKEFVRSYVSKEEASNGVKPYSISKSNFELLIKSEFENLSVRAKNALLTLFANKSPTSKEVYNMFIRHKFNPRKLQNVGNKTTSEINQFLGAISSIYHRIESSELAPGELAGIKLESLIGIRVIDPLMLNKFEDKRFPIITFSARNLEALWDLNEIECTVLKSFFDLLDRKYTLQEIGNKYDLTRERIRQIRSRLLKKFEKTKSKIQKLIEYSNYRDQIEEAPFIIFSDYSTDSDLKKEIDSHGALFASFIAAALFPNYYTLTLRDQIKRPDQIYQSSKYNILKGIKGCYLVNKSCLPKKKLLSFYKKIFESTCIRNEKDYSFTLTNFFKMDMTEDILALTKEFCSREFGITTEGERIIIKRNTPKRIFEYVHDALNAIGKPAHVSKILDQLKVMYPDIEMNEVCIRASITRYKGIFISISRTSTFGLKEWEVKYGNVKGGTIRNIVEEFLETYEEPCHISAITDYVNKYRKTDDRSVLTNLKMVTDNRFTFFTGAYVGLARKDYSRSEG